jgi:hypothetical protein
MFGESLKLAAVQAAPVYVQREAATAKACVFVRHVGTKGVTISALGETMACAFAGR